MGSGGCGRFTLRCIQGLLLLCMVITVSVSAIDEFTGGQSPSLAIITPKTVTVSCPAPCECMISSDADRRWGSGNYVSCSNTPCGEVVVSSELRVPKFCYRMQSQEVIVTTTTPVPAYVTCKAPCECLSPREATAKWGSRSSQCSASPCGKTIPLGDSLPAIKYCYNPIESNPPAVVPFQVQPPQQVIPAQPALPDVVPAQKKSEEVVEAVGDLSAPNMNQNAPPGFQIPPTTTLDIDKNNIENFTEWIGFGMPDNMFEGYGDFKFKKKNGTPVWTDQSRIIISVNTTTAYVNLRWKADPDDPDQPVRGLWQISKTSFPANNLEWKNQYVPGLVGSGPVNELTVDSLGYHYFRINFAKAANHNSRNEPYYDGFLSYNPGSQDTTSPAQVTKIPWVNFGIVSTATQLGPLSVPLPTNIIAIPEGALTEYELDNPNENIRVSTGEMTIITSPDNPALFQANQIFYLRFVPVDANGKAGIPTAPVKIFLERPQCEYTDTDPNNCGACGVKCQPGTTCCSGQCVNTNIDTLNCGACGKRCIEVIASCDKGQCTPPQPCKPLGSPGNPCDSDRGCIRRDGKSGCICCKENEISKGGDCVPVPTQISVFPGSPMLNHESNLGCIEVKQFQGLGVGPDYYYLNMVDTIYRTSQTTLCGDYCGECEGSYCIPWGIKCCGGSIFGCAAGCVYPGTKCLKHDINYISRVGIPPNLYHLVPALWFNSDFNHFGAGKVYNGLYYVPVSRKDRQETAVLVYTKNLDLIYWGWFDEGGDAWLSINPVDGMLYTSGGSPGGVADYTKVYEYDPKIGEGGLQPYDGDINTFWKGRLRRVDNVTLQFKHPENTEVYGPFTQGGDFSDTGIFYYVFDDPVVPDSPWSGVHAFKFPTNDSCVPRVKGSRVATEIDLAGGDGSGFMHVEYEPCYAGSIMAAGSKCAISRGDELEGVTVVRANDRQQIVYLTLLTNGAFPNDASTLEGLGVAPDVDETKDEATVYAWLVEDPAPKSS